MLDVDSELNQDPGLFITADYENTDIQHRSYDEKEKYNKETANLRYKLGQLFGTNSKYDMNKTLISNRNKSHQREYKLPKGAKPAMEHLNDFYEDQACKKLPKYLKRRLRVAGTHSELDSSDTMARLQRANTDEFSGMSMNNDGIHNSNEINYSNKSIDVPMEGELSLRDSKASILRKSISKIRAMKVPQNSGVDTPLFRLGRAWQSEEVVKDDTIEDGDNKKSSREKTDHNQDDEEANHQSKLQKLLSKKIGGPALVKAKSKVFRESTQESYWMKCINKCLDQKDLAKMAKIGYNETLTTLSPKLSSKDSKSGRYIILK